MISEGQQFTVCWLVLNSGKCPAADHLRELLKIDEDFFLSAANSLSRLKDGFYHRGQNTRKLAGKTAKGIFEARIMGPRKQLARFPYIYTTNSEVVLLYGFNKNGGHAPPKFVEKAKIFKELIEKGQLGYEQADLQQYQQK